MNKSLVTALVIIGLFGAVVGAYFYASAPAPVSTAKPLVTAVSPARGPNLPPASPTVSAAHNPAGPLAPASAVSRNAASATTLGANPQKPAANSPVTTLDELHQTFNAIDAAAEADTPESLQALVAYADTDNADIRSAALAGLVRRGDAAASPLLRTAAKKSDSTAEIIALLQTADYLELPSADLKAITAKAREIKALRQQSVEKPATSPAATP